ncbi:transferrin-like isoform X2 [Euwallacea fornicatus]|uniref:transferrin-like isoform X2 n=1 Tax=Euwallacea fornicatus TaxID=995702 RepID=UPI00338EF16A
MNSTFLKCLVLFVVCMQCIAQQIANKLCTDINNNDACQQISRDQEIVCQILPSKTDCILDIDKGVSTLTALNPEEAFLAAGLVSTNVIVLAEIIESNPPYETAILTRLAYKGGLGDSAKGLKFCHPGYDHEERVTKYILDEFDYKTASINCGVDTFAEEKFKSLANFFGSSCRPGTWTEDTEFDAYLKNKYPSLCELCGSKDCNTKYLAPFNDSLTCLSNGGDVALTTVKYAQEFLSVGSNANNFQYLCSDGSVSLSSIPCSWTKQLHRVLVTTRESYATFRSLIETKLSTYISGTYSDGSQQYLATLLQLTRQDTVKLLDEAKDLKSYVSERRTIPNLEEANVTKCGPLLKWSVTSDIEQNKCRWLRQASVTHGLYPVINCVKSTDNDTVSSLDNLENGSADIAFIDANFGYIARRKNLINVGYPETDISRLNRILIVVRNDSTWYTNFNDFKKKSICLPEYGGKEWLAFIDLLRREKIVNDSTDYGSIFSNFVEDSCTPGANSKDLDIFNTDTNKLCAKCYPVDATKTSKYCNADLHNKYYDSRGALLCLEEKSGDYAIIASNDLPRSYLRDPIAQQQFRVISKNGSLAAYPGFKVDEEAPIAIIISGEVVYKNYSDVQYNNTVLYLRHLEVEFGQNLEKAFKVFESFNHTKNLLFPDSTPGLTFSGSNNKYISNYRELLEYSEKVIDTTGGATRHAVSTFMGICVISILSLLI